MSATRRWHRSASAVLLIAAGVHGAAHWRHYVAASEVAPERRAVIEAMQSLILYEPLGTTLWTALGFFSLAFGAGLALFGTTHWILAREADPRTLRRHALRNTVLCALAALLTLWLHPLPQGLVIFTLAAVLYGLAAWPRAGDA